ncbi:hypothetical protein D1AOALGA4SA_6221 [Olavius algarvensis Delta 1 endosymbiont]|nr:hypothetical protein D1AOALGA4SA_6221 [Olavius algarvensis Delta 1 endosymbiont]
MKKLLIIGLALAFVCTMFVPQALAKNWKVPKDFLTIQDAIDDADVSDGDTILVGSGSFAGALVDKAVEIKGKGGAIINDGPAHSNPNIENQGFRLLSGSEGATISHLTFDGVDLAVMNGEAVDNITVTQCTFNNTIQAVSNWSGSGWEISHNVINDLRTKNGGGIGILIADFMGGIVENSVVSHNKISGVLYVWEDDGGGYNGSGIVLYADFRWNRSGADAIQYNRVVKNKISLTSDNPDVVDVVAIELTEGGDPPDGPYVFDNAIGFNDMRGTTLQLALTPETLAEVNDISRNLGDNRGHGLHPSLFGPGGN